MGFRGVNHFSGEGDSNVEGLAEDAG